MIQHDDRICCSVAVFIKPDWRGGWYQTGGIENERERVCDWTGNGSLSLSLSDLLTHTHTHNTTLQLHPTFSDWNHGRWGAANWKAERCWSEACLFSLSDKNINFQLGLKSLIGGKRVLLRWWRLWKDSQKVHVHLKPLKFLTESLPASVQKMKGETVEWRSEW